MSLRVAWLLLMLAASVSAAEDASLSEIGALLVPMRANPFDSGGPRGARPVFTEIKHKLRDWVESRLHEFRDRDEARALALELNAEVRKAGLSCGWEAGPGGQQCPEWSQLGYLGQVTLKVELGLLIATTGIGIQCGDDESAYAYEFINGKWQRFWQSEQVDYREGRYKPQNLLIVSPSGGDFSPGADPSSILILTLGREPWCSSNWHDVYYRVWQVRLDRREEKLLLDGADWANVGDNIDGLVRPREVLIEYSTLSADDSITRREVLHYFLRDAHLEREGPVALRPRDFVEEWMRTEWPASSRWIAEGSSPSGLKTWHDTERGGEFDGQALHCKTQPDHWQVALTPYKGQTPEKPVYYLVRWWPPYRFAMSGVSRKPWPGCTEEDPEADKERTLFPVHQWDGP